MRQMETGENDGKKDFTGIKNIDAELTGTSLIQKKRLLPEVVELHESNMKQKKTDSIAFLCGENCGKVEQAF